MKRILLCLAALAATAACGDGNTLGPAGSTSRTQILLGRTGGVSASVVSFTSVSAPPVDFADVASLELVIDGIQAHGEGGGGWVSIEIEPIAVDLAALAAGTVEPLAAGGLPEGTYDNLRLFLESATIVFAADATIGNQTFTGGVPYDVEIPSVEQTGLKIPTAHFTVDAGGETVVVLFDPTGSTASIGATGNGRIRMSPVFREADEATESEYEEETEEEEEDGEDGGEGGASLYLSPTRSASAALIRSLGSGLSASVLPSGGNGSLSADDVLSLRLVLCEVRAVRTGVDDADGESDDSDAGDMTSGESGDDTAGDDTAGDDTAGESDEESGADVPACTGVPGGQGWTSLALQNTEVDLFALEQGEVVEIAVGELPAGRYRNVRLYIAEAWITLATEVTKGQTTYPAETEIPLTIPGAMNTGIKIPASHFEVAADAEEAMVLLFDQSSVSGLKVTGQGIQMAPHFREASPAEVDELVNDGEGSL